MKITVLGAGAIGSAVAFDLCRRDEVASVLVCESRPATLRSFRAAFEHPKLRTYQADARDEHTLAPIADGSDCIVSCVAPEHNLAIAQFALNHGAHFVDLGSPDLMRAVDSPIAELAERTQKWVATGCGLTPGLVGVLVVHGLAEMESATEARIRVGDVPTDSTGPFQYRLGYSAEKLIDDYTLPVPVLREGQIEYRKPLTGVERIDVDGFGNMEAFYAGGGLASLAESLAGSLNRLDEKTLRYPGHADQMRFLIDLGFADKTSIDVRTHLTYRDVLLRRLRQRLGGAYEDVVLVRLEIEGVRNGEEGMLVYELVDRYDEESGLSAMQRCTGFPAAAAAVMLGRGEITGGGVCTAERLLPSGGCIESLRERGLNITERWESKAVTDEILNERYAPRSARRPVGADRRAAMDSSVHCSEADA